jgi:sialate O-acetylesterase
MKIKSRHRLLPLLYCILLPNPLNADVRMPAIFGDHMVLQQNHPISIWGWADPDEKITINLNGKNTHTLTGADGKWHTTLDPADANHQPQTLTVQGRNTLTFSDVLIGDVWIASGQSNMEFGIQSTTEAPATIAAANDPQLRMFFVPWTTSLTPLDDIAKTPADSPNGKWQTCTPEIMNHPKWAWHGITAIGYYFAKDIRQATGHPLGLIATYKGGTPAQAWTSLPGLQQDPPFTRHLEQHDKLLANHETAKAAHPQQQARYQAAMKEWTAANHQAIEEGTKPPQKPSPPPPPDGGYGAPANLYNALIAPLIPYTIKGVIWHQGESNSDHIEQALEYRRLFPRMINDWRKNWNQGDFPFLFVQLANYKAPPQTPSEGNWPWTREAQLKTLTLPHTAMAVTCDIGDPKDIHPKDKLDVGKRLALAARHTAYGEKLTHSGPIYHTMTIENNQIRLKFHHPGTGLTIGAPPWTPDGAPPAKAEKLQGFGIAAADQNFIWADATIDGDTILVTHPQIAHPVAVRYNWADNPNGNLYNQEGLPASPFRTDHWPAPAK